jgi:hypothetical protein
MREKIIKFFNLKAVKIIERVSNAVGVVCLFIGVRAADLIALNIARVATVVIIVRLIATSKSETATDKKE